MARVTREKTGVDLAAGDKPSMSMMLKLARCVFFPALLGWTPAPGFPLTPSLRTAIPISARQPKR